MKTSVHNKKRSWGSLFALLLAMTGLLNVQAQSNELTEIVISDGTEISTEVPFGGIVHNYTEIIYPSQTIGVACVIHSISFHVADTANYATNMAILMGTTDALEHTTTDGWTPMESMTTVFDSPIVFEEPGWKKIVLERPFYYLAENNLVVAVRAEVSSSDAIVPVYCSIHEGATLRGYDYGFDDATISDLRPNIKLEITTNPILVGSPVSVDMGIQPNGCWAKPCNTSLISVGLPNTLASVTSDNNYFSVTSPELPFAFNTLDTIPFAISTGTGEGIQAGTLTFTYGDSKTTEIPVSAQAYTPTLPDVWELPQQVTTFPYTQTITSEMAVYNNYQLPGTLNDGKDAVFKLTFDSDVILSAEVFDGENGKMALYREGFEGQGGPQTTNYYKGLGTNITDCYSDFENGDLGNIDWVLEAPDSYEYWSVTTNSPHSGTYCMKSNLGCWSGNSSSSISFTRYVPYDITMSFWARISSQTDCDKGYFFIDGIAKIDGISGDGDWIFYSYEVQQGLHTFKWEYTKDDDWCRYDDCFYVDDLFLWDAHTISLNSGLPVPQGSYYLIASSTSDEFTINIDTTVVPEPIAASSPMPVDGYNCYGDETVSLSWELGDYTKEYQILFGETNPPTEVLVNWSDELSESYDVMTENAKTYYWRVNERNSTGTTEGPIWSFSTYRDINASVNNIIFVSPTGAGTKDGSSWANAASSIQAAIDAAATVTEIQPVIWVAKGNYFTYGVFQTANDKTFCFLGHGGVKLYGGFNGDEPADYDLSLRDLENNATILDAESQCYVVGTQYSEWDGFVMQHGGEGGLYVCGETSTVQNCKILYSDGNGVFVDGGGLYCLHNEVSHHANDGIVQDWFYYFLDIRDCIISYNGGNGVLGNVCVRCQICNNGNGFCMRSSMGGAVIGCLIANNDGFGAKCDYIVNSTIVNNGCGISETSFQMDIVLCNSIVWGNNEQENWRWSTPYYITNNAIQGGLGDKCGTHPCINLVAPTDETGVFPEFEHPSSGVGSAYADGDWTLKASSPCINMGMEYLENIPDAYTGHAPIMDYLDVDLAGSQRIQQGRIDLGASESPYGKPNYLYPIHPDANNFIFVKENGQGNGSSWSNATSNLQEAMETSILYEPTATIWVAQGTYSVSDIPFQVKEKLKMYGGFEGTEATDYDLNQRDLVNHASVLDGNSTVRVLNQSDTLSTVTAAIIDGFTLQNGMADNGAGAYLLKNMTLSHCNVRNNTANGDEAGKGGGIYTDQATVRDCFAENNTANQGGGIYAVNSKIIQSHVSNNTDNGFAGGIYAVNSDVLQCNVVNNESDGLLVSADDNQSYAHVYNSILWGNTGNNLAYHSSMAQNNTTVSHCAIEGWQELSHGNIPLSSDNNGDFGPHFTEDWQLGEASVCIDAGNSSLPNEVMPMYDLNSAPRVQNDAVDIGVFESPYAAPCREMEVLEESIPQGETYDFYGTLLSQPGIYEHSWTEDECLHLVMLHLHTTQTYYVSENGSGSKDGSSWANALDGNTVLENGYTKLADAMQNATFGDLFWVAEGTYLPCGDNDATKHFVLNEGVEVYGGFVGTETSLEERDLENVSTIFSGELQGDDDETNNTDGVFVTTQANSLWHQNATLDGVTITKGFATSRQGAALLVNENTAVTLNLCHVQQNREGSVFSQGRLNATNSEFSNNRKELPTDYYMTIPDFTGSIYRDAGVIINLDYGIAIIDHCSFTSNHADNNGVIFNTGVLKVDETVFDDNTADNIGTIFSKGKVRLTNTTFNNNRAEYRLGVMMIFDSLYMVNCTLSNNQSNYYTSTHFPDPGTATNFPGHRTSGVEAWGYSYVDSCQFLYNDAGTCNGGALSVIGSADIINCTFIGNIGLRNWRDPNDPGGGMIGSVVLVERTDGGALYVAGNATATDCVFVGNSGWDGSTIGVTGSLIMERCKITNSTPNFNSHWGVLKNAGVLIVNNSLIVNNPDKLIYQHEGIHTIFNNTTIVNTDEALFRYQELFSNEVSTIDFNNCIISGYADWLENWGGDITLNFSNSLVNQAVCGTQVNNGNPQVDENGNIFDFDPVFVNPTNFLGYDENVDPLTYDWTLQPGSPCIDAGDVSLIDLDPLAIDLAGEPRVKNGQIDMGAYEYGTDYMIITASANPGNGGTITGAGAYSHGAIATLTATANEGYTFINWTKDGDVISTDAAYSFTVTESATYIANFEGYSITAIASPEAGGIVEGTNTYEYGATATLSATANTGYTFINWTKDGEEVSTDAIYSFTVTESGTYVANFTLNSYTISVISNPEEGGTVTGAGTYNHGAVATLTATPNEDYVFLNWSKDGTVISTDDVYNFTVTESGIYVANFFPTYHITAIAYPETGGTVNGSGVYNQDATATLTAAANEHYHFVNWTKDGEEVSTDTTYCFTVTESGTYVANFELDSYYISAEANPLESGTIEGSGLYAYGTTASLTAIANENYTFMYWTENDDIVSFDTVYSFEVTHNRDLTATFSLPLVITAEANPAEGGMVTGSGEYNYGATCTLTAIPNDGYVLRNWSKGGEILSSSATYSFTVMHEETYIANFVDEDLTCGIVFILHDSWGDGWNGNYLVVTEDNGASHQLTIESGSSASFTLPLLSASQVTLTWIQGDWTNECSFTVRNENGLLFYESSNLNSDFSYVFDVDCSTPQHTIEVETNPSIGGTVTGSGIYDYGTTITLTATPNEGYVFFNWTENGTLVSNESSYTFTVISDRTLTANFVEEGLMCDLVFNLHDSWGDGWNGNYIVVTEDNGASHQLTIESGSTASFTLPLLTDSQVTLTWIQGFDINECSFTVSYENGMMIYEGSNLNGDFSYEFNVDCSTSPRYHFTSTGNWSEASNWSDNTLPSTNAVVFIDAACTLDENAEVATLTVSDGQSLTLLSGNTLTVISTLVNAYTSGLVIKDGAQLIHSSEGVFATLEKDITGYTDDGGYYLIAVPFIDSVSIPEEMMDGNYDLYLFDQLYPNAEWRNHKAEAISLVRGQGYLYANSEDMTLALSGQMPPTDETLSVSLTYDANALYPGFNLVGNPFTCNLTSGDIQLDGVDLTTYYIVENGSEIVAKQIDSDPIKPGQGFLVQATADGQQLVFHPTK